MKEAKAGAFAYIRRQLCCGTSSAGHFRVSCSRPHQPRLVPVHIKVRQAIFNLGRNLIDLLCGNREFDTAGNVFSIAHSAVCFASASAKDLVALSGFVAVKIKRTFCSSMRTMIERLQLASGSVSATAPGSPKSIA
jgi:hypothetical protein